MPRRRGLPLAFLALAIVLAPGLFGSRLAAFDETAATAAVAEDLCSEPPLRTVTADPQSLREALKLLQPGDRLALGPGRYDRLRLEGVHGEPGRCITIAGPKGDSVMPAVIAGSFGHNTVEIVDASFVALRDLVIDNRAAPGADGIKASPAERPAHDILLEGNTLLGTGHGQQTVGISTKAAAWHWIIRGNRITEFGTGLYLGNSDGRAPFVAGLVEGNLVERPVGYCLQIKWQMPRAALPGLPTAPQSTIIRRNAFVKDDRPSPDGDRPNLLVGGFPDEGPGAHDLYEIYGNLLLHNPREALFQGSGRISFHDNVLVGAPVGAVFRNHDRPLRLAHVYSNTVVTRATGIAIESEAAEGALLRGNLVVAPTPFQAAAGLVEESNLAVDPQAKMAELFTRPVRGPELDLSPLPGAALGAPVDLSPFTAERDFDRDFGGVPKGDRRRRGAYVGQASAQPPLAELTRRPRAR